jgi:hypothetical protein
MTSNRAEWAVHPSETDQLVDAAGRGLVGELGHGAHDPAPSRRPIIVAGKR